jgi:hypothetical protein
VAADLDRRNNLSLDSLNFFLADVRDGLGPCSALTHEHDKSLLFRAGFSFAARRLTSAER